MFYLAEINRVAFNLGPIPVYWYGVIIVGGILLAIFLANREAKRVGMGDDDVTDFILWALPAAIIGARLYYVILNPSDYIADPLQVFNTRAGGLAIYGGLIAGVIVMYFFSKKRHINMWTFLDVAAPSVIIAQAIGRWGNFLNQEAYGSETTHEFLSSLHLPNFIIDNMYIEGAYRQPTFLYESLWNVLGFCLIIFLRSRPHFYKKGEVFLSYLIWYGLGRFFIEGMRTDSLMIGNVRFSQVLSLVLFAVGIAILIYRRFKLKVPDYQRDLGGQEA